MITESTKVNDNVNQEELPNFIKLADVKYQKIWESLSETDKKLIESQASLRNLDTIESVNSFWNTRALNETRFNNKSNLLENTNKVEKSSNQVLLINLMNRLK